MDRKIRPRLYCVLQVLAFLRDHWLKGSEDVVLARQALLEVVARSAADPSSPSTCVAAANAATTLNLLGEPLVHRSWAGVFLEGADLTGAVLSGTSLAGARLAGARLAHAVLRDADCSGADMTGVDFGQRAPILDRTLQRGIKALALHPTLCGVAAVASASELRFWDVQRGAPLCGPLISAHEASAWWSVGACALCMRVCMCACMHFSMSGNSPMQAHA